MNPAPTWWLEGGETTEEETERSREAEKRKVESIETHSAQKKDLETERAGVSRSLLL